MSHIAWSVCLSVRWLHWCTVLKGLNQSRCCLGADSCGLRDHVLDGFEIPRRNGQFVVVAQPIEKLWKSLLLLRYTQQKRNSVVNNGICHAMRPFIQNFWPLLYTLEHLLINLIWVIKWFTVFGLFILLCRLFFACLCSNSDLRHPVIVTVLVVIL